MYFNHFPDYIFRFVAFMGARVNSSLSQITVCVISQIKIKIEDMGDMKSHYDVFIFTDELCSF